MVFEKGWTNRAATVRERFSQPKPYRFLTGAALKMTQEMAGKVYRTASSRARL